VLLQLPLGFRKALVHGGVLPGLRAPAAAASAALCRRRYLVGSCCRAAAQGNACSGLGLINNSFLKTACSVPSAACNSQQCQRLAWLLQLLLLLLPFIRKALTRAKRRYACFAVY
jgi:hypothetical protein